MRYVAPILLLFIFPLLFRSAYSQTFSWKNKENYCFGFWVEHGILRKKYIINFNNPWFPQTSKESELPYWGHRNLGLGFGLTHQFEGRFYVLSGLKIFARRTCINHHDWFADRLNIPRFKDFYYAEIPIHLNYFFLKRNQWRLFAAGGFGANIHLLNADIFQKEWVNNRRWATEFEFLPTYSQINIDQVVGLGGDVYLSERHFLRLDVKAQLTLINFDRDTYSRYWRSFTWALGFFWNGKKKH